MRRYFAVHPVAMDVVVCLIYVLLSLLLAALRTDTPDMAVRWTVGLVAASTLALLWRRRAPLVIVWVTVAIAVASLAWTQGLGAVDVAYTFALYAVAADHRLRTSWATFAATLLVLGVAIVLWAPPLGLQAGRTVTTTGSSPDLLTATTTDLAWVDRPALGPVTPADLLSILLELTIGLIALAIGIGVYNRRLHVAALVERSAQLVAEGEQQARLAAVSERTRIAREMHDVVAHSLSVMIALADGARASVERAPDSARDALDQLSGTGRTALADMRRMLGVLRDEQPLFTPQPTDGDLGELVQGYRAAGLAVRLTQAGEPLPDHAGLRLAIYRIVQESLTNALRHAPGAGLVEARVAHHGDVVHILVTDDGGPHVDRRTASGGGGIIGMRERAAVYGGTIEAGPYRTGWRVRATLEVPEEDA